MRRTIIRIIGFLAAVCIICMMTVGADAFLDGAAWNDADLYVVLDEHEKSNNDLKFAALRVKYDYDSHRIKLLFMLEFSEVDDVSLCGVRMNFNNLGTIILMADGSEDYDPEVYYAALDDVTSDVYTGSVGIEVTVGIKDGIPDELVMRTDIVDTKGIRSNTFKVDITPTSDETDTNSLNEEKTVKKKVTSKRSSKIKTTKLKTTRTKKTKSVTKGEKPEQDKTVIDSGINTDIQQNKRRKKLTLAFGAATTFVALASGTAAAVKSKNKNKDRGHDE